MTDFINLLNKLSSQHLAIHQNRCVVVRNRNATCTKCAEACTSECITYEDNHLNINALNCVGCGTCATVCPTCAIESLKPHDPALLQESLEAMAAAGGKSVVACEKILARVDGLYDATKVVPVACLGRVDESLLVALAQKGATSITLVHNGCEECDLCPGLFTAEKVVETTNALLDTWNQPVRVTMVNKLPGFIRRAGEAEFDESRRAFFETIKDEAQAAAVITANEVIDDKLGTAKPEEPRYVKVQDDGTLPHFVPTRRERLLEELALMSEPKDELIETRLWGHVIIDIDTCSSCQMCATFCPTGAIRKFELPDGTFGVDHTPVDCVKCYCCTDICPTSALTLSSEVFATDIATKAISRYAMKPREFKTKDPHSMVNHMKKFTLCDQIYER